MVLSHVHLFRTRWTQRSSTRLEGLFTVSSFNHHYCFLRDSVQLFEPCGLLWCHRACRQEPLDDFPELHRVVPRDWHCSKARLWRHDAESQTSISRYHLSNSRRYCTENNGKLASMWYTISGLMIPYFDAETLYWLEQSLTRLPHIVWIWQTVDS